ncbi:hypothetical protein GGI17_000900 [Coemansia sp. S146]|nr:hypothetical protein GGI17_000900 [Coemansia sp. S146]
MIRFGGDFGRIARKNGLIVDKTLLCKALIDCPVETICICLPRRFGKMFNLSIVEEFFNVVTSSDVKPVDGTIDLAAGRAERFKLFEKSLLQTTKPKFFDDNFCRYPVIRINFKEVTASSLGTFYKSLAASIRCTMVEWLDRLEGITLGNRAHTNR